MDVKRSTDVATGVDGSIVGTNGEIAWQLRARYATSDEVDARV